METLAATLFSETGRECSRGRRGNNFLSVKKGRCRSPTRKAMGNTLQCVAALWLTKGQLQQSGREADEATLSNLIRIRRA